MERLEAPEAETLVTCVPIAVWMSAFGGKADMTFCGSPLLRSLLGVKRTSLFAAQISAFDPKRRCGADELPVGLLYHPCFAARLGGMSGGKETQGWRDSSHTAMVGAGKFESAKLPMATAAYPGKPSPSQ